MPPITLSHPIPLRPAHLRAIGCVASQWGYLESEIDWEIARLLTRPACASLPVNLMSQFNKRVNGWINLARLAYKEKRAIKAVEEISRRALAVKPDRDAVVHGVWMASLKPDGKPSHIFAAVYRAAMIKKTKRARMDARDIMQIAATIADINRDLGRFQDHVFPPPR